MNRRSFLQSILALGAAPAIVKAESLMKLWVPPQEIWTPEQGKSYLLASWYDIDRGTVFRRTQEYPIDTPHSEIPFPMQSWYRQLEVVTYGVLARPFESRRTENLLLNSAQFDTNWRTI